MAESTDEREPQIVCPLCLKIQIASEGRCGAIQSYRCLARANGYETRPQKTDKWSHDFYKVLNAAKGEKVTLSDGKTVMSGMGTNAKVFKFTKKDGHAAYMVALKWVKEGKLRAPRNWDRTFADEAGVQLDDLKKAFPDLYATQTRSTRGTDDEEAIESLGSGFFGDDVDVDMVADDEERQFEDDEEETDDTTDDVVMEEEEEEEEAEDLEGAFSVTAELEDELVDEEEQTTLHGHREHQQSAYDDGDMRVIQVPYPTEEDEKLDVPMGVEMLLVQIGEKRWRRFYKIEHPMTREFIFVPEGTGDDMSFMRLKVAGKPSAHGRRK